MKTSRLERIYAGGIGLIFGLIVVHAPLSVGLGTLFPRYDLLIKSWKEILMLLLIPIALILIKRHRLMKPFLRDPIFYLIVIYVAIHVFIATLFFKGWQAMSAGLIIDLRYVLYFSLVYVLLCSASQYRNMLIKVAVIGAVIVVGFATMQLFLPADILTHIGYGKNTIEPYLTVDKNIHYIRVNSTLRGPNPLGAYAGMVLALVAAAWSRGKLINQKDRFIAIILSICGAIALWISYSRSSLIAGLFAVLLVIGISQRHRISRRIWVGSGVVVCVFVGIIAFTHVGSTFISNILLHENPTGGSSVNSNQKHVQSLADGVAMLQQEPFGAGIGTTGSASLQSSAPLIIENQYLFIAHEIGWTGIVLFLALFISILIRLWQQRKEWLSLGVFASGIGLALIGLLLPVWVDDTVSIVWWGLAALALAGGYNARSTAK